MITISPYHVHAWGDQLAIFCSCPERKYTFWAGIDTRPQHTPSGHQIDDCQSFKFELIEDNYFVAVGTLNRPLDEDIHTALRLFIAMCSPDLMLKGVALSGSYHFDGELWDITSPVDIFEGIQLPDGFAP